MNYILAKNDKQLGIRLRMLFPEHKRFSINPVMNDRGKMEYYVHVDLDDERFEYYQRKYNTLIS